MSLYIIELMDIDPLGFLAFDLQEVLEAIEPEGRHLSWSIRELEATAFADVLDRPINEFERLAANSPSGLAISWDELVALSRGLKQTINGTFVGTRVADSTGGLSDEKNRFDSDKVIIHAIDGTLWEVHTRQSSIVERFKNKFRRIKVIERKEAEAIGEDSRRESLRSK